MGIIKLLEQLKNKNYQQCSTSLMPPHPHTFCGVQGWETRMREEQLVLITDYTGSQFEGENFRA